MHAPVARTPVYAAGLTVILAAALTACGSSSGGSAAAGGSSASGGSSAAVSATPLDAVRLAAKTSTGASSFSGTMSLRATTKAGSTSGSTSLNATFSEQLRPALLAQVDISSLSAAGNSLPGGLTEVLTPSKFYLKWSYLTTLLHTTKPWIAIPVSSLSKTSGVNLSQIFSQATTSNPLTESSLLAGATSVRRVGTATVGGVSVTEYTGKLSLDKGIKYLSASSRSQVQKAFSVAGITTATFTVWIDAKHTVRKSVVSEKGTTVTETVTTTITSIDQPVSVSIPAPGQTGALPGGNL